jgi:hypothetical protein
MANEANASPEMSVALIALMHRMLTNQRDGAMFGLDLQSDRFYMLLTVVRSGD